MTTTIVIKEVAFNTMAAIGIVTVVGFYSIIVGKISCEILDWLKDWGKGRQ